MAEKPADKPESAQETIARLKAENRGAHPPGCFCRGCNPTPQDGI